MATLADRTAAITAAVLIGLGATCVGTGTASADPYDDDGGTVQVQPDYGGSEPDYGPQPDEQPNEPEQQVIPDEEEPAPAPGQAADEGTDDGKPDAGHTEPSTDATGDPAPSNTDAGGSDSPSDSDTGDESPTDAAPVVSDANVATADSSDVDIAQTATGVAAHAAVASTATIDTMRTTIESQYLSSSSTITQWNSSWVQYDQYYQPVLVNPYRTAIQFAYVYADSTYVVEVQPLQRAVLNVPKPGVYSFTALVPNSSGGVSNVSVGSFSGGGYVPRPGQPPPPKPAVPTTYRNVIVHFVFGDQKYEPVTIKSVTDLGKDPQMGANKVLLDEETPAWGTWNTTSSGQRELTVTSTERLPGLTKPSAEPPQDYKLVAAQQTSPKSTSTLGWVGLGLGVAAVCAVGVVLVIGRRRRTTT